MTHKNYILIVATIGVIAITATVWVFKYQINKHRKVEVEAGAIGNVLMLFVEDNGRMPTNMQELFEKNYLTRSRGQYPMVGKSQLGRSPTFGTGPIDTPLQYLAEFDIRFNGLPDDKPLLSTHQGTTPASVERMSILLELTLQQAQSTPSTEKAVSSGPADGG